jgi:preprotein translocase subunit Sss1
VLTRQKYGNILIIYSEEMEKEEREVIRHIDETLIKILTVLSKPTSILTRVFEIAATGITILGVISVVDIIKGWIGG